MKWQGVILYTCVLDILVFSSMVGYLDGSIDCEGGISPFFLKIGHCFNYFNTCLMLSRPVPATCTVLSRPVPATCTVLTVVCRRTCCTIAACWYTCTYNMLYSLSYIREQCDDGWWAYLKFFPLTSPFPSQEQDSYSRSWSLNAFAMMMEAARTAALLVLLFQSI